MFLFIKRSKHVISIFFFFLMIVNPLYAINKGDIAPEIFGRTTSGNLFKLSAENGTLRLINFFSVTCTPCKKELPELAEMEKMFQHIKFISVHASDWSNEDVKKFIKKLPLSPELIVCGSNAIKKDYGFRGFPYTIIIDANGKVIEQFFGYSKNNMKQIKKILMGL